MREVGGGRGWGGAERVEGALLSSESCVGKRSGEQWTPRLTPRPTVAAVSLRCGGVVVLRRVLVFGILIRSRRHVDHTLDVAAYPPR